MKRNPRLNELIDLYLNQRLDEVGRFELVELLREDPGNRREFWRRAEIEGLLQEWGRSHEGVDGVNRIGMAAERPCRWWSRWPGKALGIAAAVALVASLWIQQAKERVRTSGHDSVARLTQVSEARWRGGTPTLEPGQLIGIGDLEMESGWAVFEFVSGNEVMIGGPAKVHVSAANEIECSEGRLTIRQSASSPGFRVRTPSGVIGNIYQAAALRVDPDGTTVLVDTGKASLRLENGTSSPIPAGEALRIDHDGTLVKRPDLKEALNLQLQRGEQLRTSGKPLPAQWLSTSKRLNEHPDLLLRYTFDDVSRDLLRVPNQAVHGVSGLDGVIGGASIREGRWPSKKALQFDRRFDGVRVKVPGSYESATMTAWIQLHGLDHAFNGLFMSDGIKKGGFHWQIMNSGALQMGVLEDINIYASPPVITSEDFGKWLHVAVVYDLREHSVKHYLNGNQVARINLVEPADRVEIGSAMLGNWDPAEDQNDDMIRNFRGRIDDFAIYRKSLSGDEIKRLFDEGRN